MSSKKPSYRGRAISGDMAPLSEVPCSECGKVIRTPADATSEYAVCLVCSDPKSIPAGAQWTIDGGWDYTNCDPQDPVLLIKLEQKKQRISQIIQQRTDNFQRNFYYFLLGTAVLGAVISGYKTGTVAGLLSGALVGPTLVMAAFIFPALIWSIFASFWKLFKDSVFELNKLLNGPRNR